MPRCPGCSGAWLLPVLGGFPLAFGAGGGVLLRGVTFILPWVGFGGRVSVCGAGCEEMEKQSHRFAMAGWLLLSPAPIKVSSEQRPQLNFGCAEWSSPYKYPLFSKTASLRGWLTPSVLPPL